MIEKYISKEEWDKFTSKCEFIQIVHGGAMCKEPTGHYCDFKSCPKLELQNKKSSKIRYVLIRDKFLYD